MYRRQKSRLHPSISQIGSGSIWCGHLHGGWAKISSRRFQRVVYLAILLVINHYIPLHFDHYQLFYFQQTLELCDCIERIRIEHCAQICGTRAFRSKIQCFGLGLQQYVIVFLSFLQLVASSVFFSETPQSNGEFRIDHHQFVATNTDEARNVWS